MLRVVICNCSPDESRAIAMALVEEKLAACVNILPHVTSVYVWNGELCEDGEHMLVIKTTDARYEAMKQRLDELHSYEVPEIIALEPMDVLASYARWAEDSLRQVE